MALLTKLATSNTTPDPGQGGAAVTSPTNTGHAASTSSGLNGTSEEKSCIWQSFTAAGGQIATVILKVTHTSSGSLSGAGSNTFRLEYSLNGGGAWTTAVSRSNYTSTEGPTVFSVGLSISQNLTQVRVRDFIGATTFNPGDAATAAATISSIQIEVVTVDGRPIVMM